MPEGAPAPDLLARKILEARRVRGDGAPLIDATFRAVAGALSELVGDLGYRALARRALHLGVAHAPELAAGPHHPEFPERGWETLVLERGAERAHECAVILLAELLTLFAEFVGRELTTRLVGRAFPELHLGEFTHGEGS